jgi:hypothetical protein
MILDGASPVQHTQQSHTLFTDGVVKVRCNRVKIIREQVAVGVQRQ